MFRIEHKLKSEVVVVRQGNYTCHDKCLTSILARGHEERAFVNVTRQFIYMAMTLTIVTSHCPKSASTYPLFCFLDIS